MHDPLRLTLTRDACCRDGAAQGIWPAHWMMPDVEACWPDLGEMDILEMINGDGRVHATYHWEANYPAKNCSQVRVRRCLEPPMFECGGTVMYCHSRTPPCILQRRHAPYALMFHFLFLTPVRSLTATRCTAASSTCQRGTRSSTSALSLARRPGTSALPPHR